MKRKKMISAILIILGFVPFAVALICGLPIFRASNLTYGDFLILYSYLFWPTYILGVLLLAAGIIWRIAQKRTPKTDDK